MVARINLSLCTFCLNLGSGRTEQDTLCDTHKAHGFEENVTETRDDTIWATRLQITKEKGFPKYVECGKPSGIFIFLGQLR